MDEKTVQPAPAPAPAQPIPEEAKALAGAIISEAIKLIPQPVPSTMALDGAALMRKLETVEKNLYVVFCIVEKIYAEMAPTREDLMKAAAEVDKKVLKKRMKG